jgi:hypothetical protein
MVEAKVYFRRREKPCWQDVTATLLDPDEEMTPADGAESPFSPWRRRIDSDPVRSLEANFLSAVESK